MMNTINKLKYKDRQWGTFSIKSIISSKRKIGLGNFTMEDLSNKLNKPTINKFERKKVILSHI